MTIDQKTGNIIAHDRVDRLADFAERGTDINALAKNQLLVLERIIGTAEHQCAYIDGQAAPQFFVDTIGRNVSRVPWFLRDELRRARRQAAA